MLHISAQVQAALLVLMSLGCRPDAAPAALPEALLGRWEGVVEEGLYVEEWRSVGDNTFEGKAILYEDGQPAGEELMRITRFADEWLFLASTGGRRITSFVRVPEVDGAWVFENREHDFPQRIGYRVMGDSLHTYIALLDDQSDRMDVLLHRVKQ